MRALILAAALAAGPALAQDTPRPEGAMVYFIGLQDGDTVSSPLTVHFGLRGMGVAPAGVEIANTGHHHLMINRPPLGEGDFGAEEFDLAMPNDETHRHFGAGQTEVTLDLPPGEHTLQLVLADAGHVPHEPPVVSDRITVIVE